MYCIGIGSELVGDLVALVPLSALGVGVGGELAGGVVLWVIRKQVNVTILVAKDSIYGVAVEIRSWYFVIRASVEVLLVCDSTLLIYSYYKVNH